MRMQMMSAYGGGMANGAIQGGANNQAIGGPQQQFALPPSSQQDIINAAVTAAVTAIRQEFGTNPQTPPPQPVYNINEYYTQEGDEFGDDDGFYDDVTDEDGNH